MSSRRSSKVFLLDTSYLFDFIDGHQMAKRARRLSFPGRQKEIYLLLFLCLDQETPKRNIFVAFSHKSK